MRPIYHVITPGDHYSPRTGSAIPTVVHGLATGAALADDVAEFPQRVILERWTYEPRYPSAGIVEYAPGRPAPGRQRYVDALGARLGIMRRGAVRSFTAAAGAVRDQPPGIVLAHNAPIVSWLLRDSPHQTVLYAHNDLLRSYTRSEAARVLGPSNRIIAVSDSLAGHLSASLPKHLVSRIRVVPNGVDAEVFSPRETRPAGPVRVMFVGRMIPDKGADILLTAAQNLGRSDVEYTIVGSHGFDSGAALSDYERQLRRQAAEVPAPVAFLPFVPRSALPELLGGADILVLPSRWQEPWALTAGEGMAMGMAVVAARVGGIPQNIGDAGVLFDPRNPAELSAALADLIENPSRRERFGRAARARAQSHDWTWAWRQLAAVLQDLD